MKNVTTPTLIADRQKPTHQAYKGEQLSSLLRMLLLRHIEKACENFDTSLDELMSQSNSASDAEEHMMKFFKYPNATYLTHTLF